MKLSNALLQKARPFARKPDQKLKSKKLSIANNNLETKNVVDLNPGINHVNIMGFCIVFAFFIAGLITSTVIASKIIMLGSFILPASVFIWALTYPCSDIVAEVYGRRYANKMVMGGFIAYILMLLIIREAVAMTPAPFWDKQEAFITILGVSQRVMVAALISYGITQFIDVSLFGWFRKKTKGKHLWIRNNCSTFISQTMTNIIFVSIVFLGEIPMDKWWQLFSNNLMARYVLMLSDTAIVYAAVYALYRFYPELKHHFGTRGHVTHGLSS